MGRMLNRGASGIPGNRVPVSPPPRRGAATAAPVPRVSNAFPAPGRFGFSVPESDPSSLQKLAFIAGLGMLFVRVGGLPELLASLLHANTYLLYVVGPPAILGAIVTGGVGRTLRHRSGLMWFGFLAWMCIALPFSSWIGGSVEHVRSYALISFPLLFTVGGLTVNWNQVRSTFTTIGVAGVFFIGTAALLAKPDAEGRLKMTDITMSIGNSNDLASHLILVLPFIILIALDKRRIAAIRLFLIVPIAYACFMILKTASRGALVALFVAFLFVLLRGSAKQRTAAVVCGLVLAVSVPIFLSGNALERLSTLFEDGNGASSNDTLHEEAKESRDLRSYLLKQSLIFTVQHPLLGVGPGQFSNFVGKTAQAEGRRGAWNETHNTFTEVSSECGIPALIFFTAGIVIAFVTVNRTYRRARLEGYGDIATASFCYLLSMVAYMVSIVFLANAYRFYLPLLIGLAIALTSAAEQAMSGRSPLPPAQMNGRVSPMPVRTVLARS